MDKEEQLEKVTEIVNKNKSVKFMMFPIEGLCDSDNIIKEAIEGYHEILAAIPDSQAEHRATVIAAINNCSTAVRVLERWQDEWSDLFNSAVSDSMGVGFGNGMCWHRRCEKDWRTGRGFNTNLYLMKDGHTGLHKIGRSVNPSTRERTLQAQVPLLEMVWSCEAMLTDESILHEIFANKRVRGEWFDLSLEDIEYIRSHKWEEGK